MPRTAVPPPPTTWAAWAPPAQITPSSTTDHLTPPHPPCSFVNSIPIAGAFLTGMLPGLALKIFLALVPMFIVMMNKVRL